MWSTWAAITLVVTSLFAGVAAHNLNNYPPLSNDEGELMAVGYSLATHGVLGSEMYVGFFGGDRHHFESLPVQHVLQALSFRLFGPGVAQARLVSVTAAVVLVWVVGWLAVRWYGLIAGILCELLLVAWRSDLTATTNGIPLLGVARTARYDVLAVTAAWLAVGALDIAIRRRGVITGFLVGACAGVAALSQFFGMFVLPVIALGWIWNTGRRWRDRTLVWMIVGAAAVVAPYAVFVASNASDALAQLMVFGNRGAFWQAGFLEANVRNEPLRFSHLLFHWPPVLDVRGAEIQPDPVSQWLLLGVVPAFAVIALARRRSMGNRLLLVNIVVFGGLLLLLDQTKAPLYAIALVPALCLGLAGGVHYVLRGTSGLLRMTCAGACLVASAVVLLEGVHVYRVDLTRASSVSPYLMIGQQIESELQPASSVLGPERWWWALHEHPYLSLRNIWFQWVARANATGQTPRFSDWIPPHTSPYVVVNNNVRDDIRDFPPPLQAQFKAFLDGCTTQIGEVDDPNAYFDTQIYQVTGSC